MPESRPWTPNSRGEQQLAELQQQGLFVPLSPKKTGKLTLDRCLGSGAFAKVWQGRWQGSDVAVKVVVLRGRSAAVKVHLLKGIEANYLREISHPNVIQTFHVYKVCDEDAQNDVDELAALRDANLQEIVVSEIWIVQELCSMGDLKQNAERICPKAAGGHDVLLHTIREVANALQYLHELGIVHGDVKRENVLLKPSSGIYGFTAKVADFGLARNLRGREAYYTASMSGDVKYLAPEVMEYNKVSVKMDTYSLGLLMYELATGSRIWEQNCAPPVHMHRILHDRARPEFPPWVLPEIAELAQSCWQHEPEARPCDAAIVARVEELLNAHGRPQTPERTDSGANRAGCTFVDEKALSEAHLVSGYFVPQLPGQSGAPDRPPGSPTQSRR
uniref:Kinase-like protein n=1 Tax=Tetraselmis sp. GSL018 TaxID=582737 RepID=A0A061RVN9_9CHLO